MLSITADYSPKPIVIKDNVENPTESAVSPLCHISSPVVSKCTPNILIPSTLTGNTLTTINHSADLSDVFNTLVNEFVIELLSVLFILYFNHFLSETDFNINHFANEKILENRYYEWQTSKYE